MQFQAVIFDMDGLLIDTEPLWRNAEVRVITSLGVSMTHDECRETMGLRLDQAIRHIYERKKWRSEKSLEEVGEMVVEDLISQVRAGAKAKPGVEEVIKLFEDLKLRMCVASSSSSRIIKEVIEHLGIADKFEFYHSAEFEPEGKPHPAVFNSTLQKLNLTPTQCLVLEDSARGVAAAKAAGIPCVGVPDDGTDPEALSQAGAKLVLATLLDFRRETFDLLV